MSITEEYQIGQHFMSYVINGDATSLSDDEEELISNWERKVLGASDLAYFECVEDSEKEFARCEVTGLMGRTSVLRVHKFFE